MVNDCDWPRILILGRSHKMEELTGKIAIYEKWYDEFMRKFKDYWRIRMVSCFMISGKMHEDAKFLGGGSRLKRIHSTYLLWEHRIHKARLRLSYNLIKFIVPTATVGSLYQPHPSVLLKGYHCLVSQYPTSFFLTRTCNPPQVGYGWVRRHIFGPASPLI